MRWFFVSKNTERHNERIPTSPTLLLPKLTAKPLPVLFFYGPIKVRDTKRNWGKEADCCSDVYLWSGGTANFFDSARDD